MWLERKVMPDSVLRHFMTEIESHNDDKDSSGNGPRRLSRSERAVDDPVREMEGMLVDEYGRLGYSYLMWTMSIEIACFCC